jgi:hypothetical protein
VRMNCGLSSRTPVGKSLATARPVEPMPALNQGVLTFAAVMSLFDQLLNIPSGGAYEQFVVASLLHAKVEQTNVPGHRTERVETKKLTAADASSGAAADIQIKAGSRTVEAFEVTANPWPDKLEGARAKMRAHDLARLHIIAKVEDIEAVLRDLRDREEDISVLDLLPFVASLLAELTKAGRANALNRLYQLLDRYQAEIARVNDYVRLLHATRLTAQESGRGHPESGQP